MLRYATFLTFPDQTMMAVEVGYITAVTTETIAHEGEHHEVCHLHAGPRQVVTVRADLDTVLQHLRDAS